VTVRFPNVGDVKAPNQPVVSGERRKYVDRFLTMSVFAKVVEFSSFAAAARQLEMSPAAVSKHVQALESRLGVRLLNRTTRHVSVTEVGREYYRSSRRILADLEGADQAASQLQAAPRGMLRVSAPVAFGSKCVAPAISAYLEAYPDVSIDLSLENRYVDLIEERIDLAVRIGHLADSTLIARRLLSSRMVLCASPGYLERHGTPASLHELAHHDCLLSSHTSARPGWHFSKPDGEPIVMHVSGRVQANNSDVLRTLALDGRGILLQAKFIVDDDIRAGRLVPLLPAYRPADAPIQAVYPHSRYMPGKARTFVDFLADRFSRELERGRQDTRENQLAASKLRVAS
jgi:DNA-binding transcriptional LysR family regulator